MPWTVIPLPLQQVSSLAMTEPPPPPALPPAFPPQVSSPDGSSGISPLLKQLSKLVFVQSIDDLTDIPFVNRELMLVKVRTRRP